MRRGASRVGLAAVPALLLAGVAGALPGSLHAQRARPSHDVIISGTPETPDYHRPKTGFKLFSLGDLAASGMHMTGQFGWYFTNLGPCSDGFSIGECGDVFKNGGFQFNWFEVNITAGTPVSEFRKIRSLFPGIGPNVKGGGYTVMYNYTLFSGRAEFGPSDGSIGTIFSGVTSTADGSCRDNQGALNGYISAGVSLLAGSNCPETWGPSGFQGPRAVPDTVFLAALKADKTNFNFDFFKIPSGDRDQTGFLGDFSTYGDISDHYAEMIRSYGGVTPQGTGVASIPGYPLGLDVHFESFQFALPTINNAAFYQLTVVNNSAKLYGGAGVNYDSLYMGLETGFGSSQASNVYYIPSQGAVKETQSGVNPGCNGSFVPAGVSNCANIGFRDGAVGIIMLKSPIGDLRNKLLSRPGPFFEPTNIHAGDTITFNHGHSCGFGGCWANTWNANDRRGFGMISSTPDNILDGRSPNELGASEYWRIFKNKAFPVRDSRFNTYIPPGNWDYNHDGVPDTLHLDTCDLQGCVATWADTMPGKQTNLQGNVGGVMTAGPFKLKAGDTTSFVIAFVGAPDSASFEALVGNVIDAYLSFFLTPKPPPAPAVSAVQVNTGNSGDPFVQLFFTDAPVRFVDPFLTKFANDLETSQDPSLARLRALNPNLVEEIRARAASNFSEVLIFKSCDNGNTFTADASCRAAPTVDALGRQIGVGFQAYAVLRPDPNTGQIPLTFVDRNVIGGQTYLYSFVARSRGFTTTVIDSVDGVLTSRPLTIADTLQGALARSGPTVAKVYVPISMPAGATLANATFAVDTAGGSTLPIGVRFTTAPTAGSFRLVFGNSFLVHERTDTLTHQVTTQVIVQDLLAKALFNDTTRLNFLVHADTFVTTGTVPVSGDISAETTFDSASFHIRTFRVSGFGTALVSGTEALFVSQTLTGTAATPPEFINGTRFPGFILDINAIPGDSLFINRILRAGGDTVRTDIQNSFAIGYIGPRGARPNGTGVFQFKYVSDPFGPKVPFTLGTATTAQDFAASLAARPTGQTADTSSRIAALVAAAVPAYAGKPLVAARFPFSVSNVTFNKPGILVMVKRAALGRPNSILLGNGNDTLRVSVPEDMWMPGDEFVVMQAVTRDSTVAGGAVFVSAATGQPVQVTDTVVVFGPATLGCTSPRSTCNPLAINTPGATGYLPMQSGWSNVVGFNAGFTVASDVRFQTTPLQPVAQQITKQQLKGIRVVPNPFVFQSQFDVVGGQRIGDPRVIFSGLPARGTIRIYSVSGQMLQQLTYTEADLNGSGDLPYNLRTREGLQLATGLYIYVVTAKSASGDTQVTRGKFSVIR